MINHRHDACAVDSERCGLCCTRIENFGVTAGKTVILHDIDLHIHCGELTAIIGPNGAGKSTLLKAILGEVRHTGELRFMRCGSNPQNNPVLGYVPQQLDFDPGSPTSVADLFAAAGGGFPVWLSRRKKTRDRLVESLRRARAEHLADRRLGELSGGELQRVMLALALEPLPEILLLDEPVSGIDHNGMKMFYNTVSELREKYDMSIILVSHDFDLVSEYADRVVLLNRTIKFVGTPEEVFASYQAHELFGTIYLRGSDGMREVSKEDGGE